MVDEADKNRFLQASSLSLESVISVEGTVRARPPTQVNKDMETGDMEVVVEKMCVDCFSEFVLWFQFIYIYIHRFLFSF